MKLSLLFSIFLVTFQPIVELSIAIDMNAIANSNVKLGTHFITVYLSAIVNSNIKLAIALYCNGYKVQELVQDLNFRLSIQTQAKPNLSLKPTFENETQVKSSFQHPN